MTDRYAVIGNPVAHSKSPIIHALFAQQTGQDLVYQHLLAPVDGFVATVEQFRAAGGVGLNVTVPFKLEAFALADQHSARARDAQAVNVLHFTQDGIVADNTDGAGLVHDIEGNLDFPLADRRVLLMGAGGAAQGAMAPLLAAMPRLLVIANRTAHKALALAERFAGRNAEIRAANYEALADETFDLVINATSTSLNDTVPPLPAGVYARGALAYDMMYGKQLTPFLELARAQGVLRVCDGLGMLVEQAAESFLIWRGVRPRTAEVIARLRQ